MFLFLFKAVDLLIWRNAHDQYTNPLARPLLIALQVVRTLFGLHLRECMGSSFPPPLVLDSMSKSNSSVSETTQHLSRFNSKYRVKAQNRSASTLTPYFEWNVTLLNVWVNWQSIFPVRKNSKIETFMSEVNCCKSSNIHMICSRSSLKRLKDKHKSAISTFWMMAKVSQKLYYDFMPIVFLNV